MAKTTTEITDMKRQNIVGIYARDPLPDWIIRYIMDAVDLTSGTGTLTKGVVESDLKAITFNGTTDSLNKNSDAVKLNGKQTGLTVSLWFRYPTLTSLYGTIGAGTWSTNNPDGFGIYLNNSSTPVGKLTIMTNNNYRASTNGTDPNVWNFGAIRITSSTITIDLNGVKTTYTGVSVATFTQTVLSIGLISGLGRFNGQLDDIRFYDRSLSDSEIQLLYTNKKITS